MKIQTLFKLTVILFAVNISLTFLTRCKKNNTTTHKIPSATVPAATINAGQSQNYPATVSKVASNKLS